MQHKSNKFTIDCVNQVMAVMIQDRPFDATLASSTSSRLLSIDIVSDIIRCVPRFFFNSTRSIGIQNTKRHRSILKQRDLFAESRKHQEKTLVCNPHAFKDSHRVSLGIAKAEEFFRWAETDVGLSHNEATCRQMACLLIRACRISRLWRFLKQTSRSNRDNINPSTISCLIKVLGDQGLVSQAYTLFKEMRRYYCKPDVKTYNNTIRALCQIGSFKKAMVLFNKMDLPGFWCPPDPYTYAILIDSHCKRAVHTGSRKLSKLWLREANRLFKTMIFKGLSPDVVVYNSLINGCLKGCRIDRASELFNDMVTRGCAPNRITYNCFIRYHSRVDEVEKAVEMLRMMQKNEHGVASNSSYTPIIHSLCESGKALEAYGYFVELVESGSVPREYTYKLVCDALAYAGFNDQFDDAIRKRIEEGIGQRSRLIRKFKSHRSWKNV